MKALLHRKVHKKELVFLELIHLYLKKLTPEKVGLHAHRLTFAHVMRHAILFLQNIFWYCSTMLLLSVCLRLSDDKYLKLVFF